MQISGEVLQILRTTARPYVPVEGKKLPDEHPALGAEPGVGRYYRRLEQAGALYMVDVEVVFTDERAPLSLVEAYFSPDDLSEGLADDFERRVGVHGQLLVDYAGELLMSRVDQEGVETRSTFWEITSPDSIYDGGVVIVQEDREYNDEAEILDATEKQRLLEQIMNHKEKGSLRISPEQLLEFKKRIQNGMLVSTRLKRNDIRILTEEEVDAMAGLLVDVQLYGSLHESQGG